MYWCSGVEAVWVVPWQASRTPGRLCACCLYSHPWCWVSLWGITRPHGVHYTCCLDLQTCNRTHVAGVFAAALLQARRRGRLPARHRRLELHRYTGTPPGLAYAAHGPSACTAVRGRSLLSCTSPQPVVCRHEAVGRLGCGWGQALPFARARRRRFVCCCCFPFSLRASALPVLGSCPRPSNLQPGGDLRAAGCCSCCCVGFLPPFIGYARRLRSECCSWLRNAPACVFFFPASRKDTYGDNMVRQHSTGQVRQSAWADLMN